jgi:diguanylate cyclase (GGDEF)-like protein
MSCRIVLLFIGLLVGVPYAAAAPAVQLGPAIDQVPLQGRFEYLEDAGGRLTLADLTRSGAAHRFLPSQPHASMNFGYSPSAYWLRLPVALSRDAGRAWLLEFAYASLDRVEVFVPDGKGGHDRLQAGDRQPFSSRPYGHRNLVFPLTLAPGTEQTIYARVVSEGNLTLPATLWTPEGLHQADLRTYPIFALYYGALAALAAYNLFLFFLIRDRRYLLYVAFAGCMIVGQASLNGFANQFLWPESPVWGNAVFPAAMAATGFFGALFTRSFLETPRMAPGLDKLALVCVAWFALAAIGPFVLPYRLAAINVSLSGIVFSILAVAGGVLCLLRDGPGARFFLIAWALLLAGVAITGARNFGWLPTNDFTSHAMQIGSALEMLLLSSALADRINSMRKEKERAQADALLAKQSMVEALQRSEQGLEVRVAQRTRELADANRRLQESEEALRHLAYHDQLTGLANRALMEDRINQAIEHAKRYDFYVAVLLVDLDRFKPINDSFGHSAGDEVLKAIGRRLRDCVRASDTVARIGGDEFVAVLDQLQGVEDANRVAKSITRSLGEPFMVQGQALGISASIGLALYPLHASDAQSLIKHADKAMYTAKSEARNAQASPDLPMRPHS